MLWPLNKKNLDDNSPMFLFDACSTATSFGRSPHCMLKFFWGEEEPEQIMCRDMFVLDEFSI